MKHVVYGKGVHNKGSPLRKQVPSELIRRGEANSVCNTNHFRNYPCSRLYANYTPFSLTLQCRIGHVIPIDNGQSGDWVVGVSHLKNITVEHPSYSKQARTFLIVDLKSSEKIVFFLNKYLVIDGDKGVSFLITKLLNLPFSYKIEIPYKNIEIKPTWHILQIWHKFKILIFKLIWQQLVIINGYQEILLNIFCPV
ncbi:hypothetical protein NQ317_006863 [Molorchus minor]|uniref:Uncharacterized protein n=1 Tax=Molorchus minor TaxID=1323400 RepID=A0ABQ9K2C9_9CUCU|nr:hypothetical protein NQ317_006863 [Molorchus minor]